VSAEPLQAELLGETTPRPSVDFRRSDGGIDRVSAGGSVQVIPPVVETSAFPSRSAAPAHELVPRLIITVYGDPAPQGSKKFVGVINGRGMLVESSKRVKPWRAEVERAAREATQGAAPLDGNLVLRMVFTMPKPLSSPKRKRTWPNKKPDVSKLCRSTEDALKTAGAIADDSRIVEYARLAKVYPNEDPEALSSTGVRIEIGRLES
jgi:Holliday junction resolvase RusA-like endonuclease